MPDKDYSGTNMLLTDNVNQSPLTEANSGSKQKGSGPSASPIKIRR